MQKDEQTSNEPDGRVEVFINGTDLLFYEYYSHEMVDKIVEKLRQDYGLEFDERCHSMCG